MNRYDKFINSLKKNRDLETFEVHHIIPKCMGGGDNKSNLIKLTPREHFIAHLMLHRANPESKSLLKALQAMFRSDFFTHGAKLNGRKYDTMRRYAFRKTAKPSKDILYEEYYTNKKSLAKIAKQFDVSEPTVKKWYINTFDNFNTLDHRKFERPSKQILALDLINDKYPYLKVREKYKISASLLYAWRKDYNLTSNRSKKPSVTILKNLFIESKLNCKQAQIKLEEMGYKVYYATVRRWKKEIILS